MASEREQPDALDPAVRAAREWATTHEPIEKCGCDDKHPAEFATLKGWCMHDLAAFAKEYGAAREARIAELSEERDRLKKCIDEFIAAPQDKKEDSAYVMAVHSVHLLNGWAQRLAMELEGEAEEHEPQSHLSGIEQMIPRLKRERTDMAARLATLEAELAEIKARNAVQFASLATLDAEVGATRAQLGQARADLAAQQATTIATHRALTAAETQLAQARAALEDLHGQVVQARDGFGLYSNSRSMAEALDAAARALEASAPSRPDPEAE